MWEKAQATSAKKKTKLVKIKNSKNWGKNIH